TWGGVGGVSCDGEGGGCAGEADLPQGGQIGQPPADVEVVGVVDRGLGPQRSSFLVVLLDRGVLVVDIQVRRDVLGNHPSAKSAWRRALATAVDPTIEDQLHAVRTAEVEVVADDLLEEHPPGD